MLFVGTKRQAAEPITAAAKRSAQYYVNARWLGGMLTNWKTISRSIQRLRELDQLLSGEAQGLTKKERLTLTRERDKLEKALGGIKDMGGVPDLIFVIDTNKEAIAIQEANRLGIPVAAVVDSNCDPDHITYPIPGNDDAGRAITLYCDLIARAAIDGISRAQGEAGVDIGASEEVHEPVILEAVDGGDGAPMPPAAAKAQARKAAPPGGKDKKRKPTMTPLFDPPEAIRTISRRSPASARRVEEKLHDLGVTKLRPDRRTSPTRTSRRSTRRSTSRAASRATTGSVRRKSLVGSRVTGRH